MTKKDVVNDIGSTIIDGAGSWRSKAKDYQANGDTSSTLRTLEERKRLNIAFVTGNAMKQREINIILSNNAATSADGESLVNLRILDVDLPEIQEINTEAVAKNKAIQGAQLAGGACVVEDTSLEFNALGGMPGPFIKWFQDSLGSEGLYKILQAYEDKSATAVCTLAFCPYPHADPVLFTGRCTGTIVEPVEGRGFGWDSIFVPDGQTVPFSCMKTEQKCELSHRSMAVMKWADWLGNNINELYDRQYGKPAIGHKGLDFRPSSSEQ
jgi:inosine triphosphate pyrophosphatase